MLSEPLFGRHGPEDLEVPLMIGTFFRIHELLACWRASESPTPPQRGVGELLERLIRVPASAM